MFKIIIHHRNANQNHNEMPLHIHYGDYNLRKDNKIVDEIVEKLELLYTGEGTIDGEATVEYILAFPQIVNVAF
jgi:hypothetical protein